MKTAVKTGLVLLLALLLTAGLFAGGQKEAPKAQQKVNLVYLSKWNVGELTQQIIDSAIQDWVTAHPNVSVERLWSGRTVNAKLMAMLQANTPPDFYDEDPKLVEESLGKAGQALDLLPYMKKAKAADQDMTVFDTFPQGLFTPWTFRGQVNTLPIQMYDTVMWYDKTWAAKAGLTKLPDTWPEFLDLCAKIKSMGTAPIVMDGGVNFYNMYYFSHLVERQLGLNAFMDAVYDKTGKAWDDPGMLKAAQYTYDLKKNGYVIKGFEGYQFPAGQIDWVQRKGAFLLIHSYMPIEVKDAKPADFVFGSFSFPAIPGGKGKQYDVAITGGGVAILKATKDPDLAFDMLKQLVSLKTQTRFANEALNVPAIKGVKLPDIFADMSQILAKQTGAFQDVAGGPGAFEPEYAQTIMYPIQQQLLFNQITPEQFIQTIKSKSIDYWKNK